MIGDKTVLWLCNEVFCSELAKDYGENYRDTMTDRQLEQEIKAAEDSLLGNWKTSGYPDGWKNRDLFLEARDHYSRKRPGKIVVVRGIDDKTHRLLKIKAIREGTTLQDLIKDTLRDSVSGVSE